MIISDGEMYKLQSDAAKEARETARLSPGYNESLKKPMAKSDDAALLIAVIAVLLADGCNDTLLLAALVLLAFT